MKNQQQKTFILIALAVIVMFLLARPIIFQKNTESAAKPVKQLLEEAYAVDKPLAIIFTYNAECCPGTEDFFMAYEKEVLLTLDKYKGIEPVWLNVGVESKVDQDEIMIIAQEYEVSQVPSMLILDNNRKKIGLIMGEFNAQEAESLLQTVLGS